MRAKPVRRWRWCQSIDSSTVKDSLVTFTIWDRSEGCSYKGLFLQRAVLDRVFAKAIIGSIFFLALLIVLGGTDWAVPVSPCPCLIQALARFTIVERRDP